jgi:hypothetical protein
MIALGVGNRTSVGTNWIKGSLLIAALLAGCVTVTTSEEAARNRVIEFFTKLNSGEFMRAEDWLAQRTIQDPTFSAFGGLPRMTRQVAARAGRCGGLRSVEIKSAAREEDSFNMTVQMTYRDPSNCQDLSSAATTEPETWRVKAIQERGMWKLEL